MEIKNTNQLATLADLILLDPLISLTGNEVAAALAQAHEDLRIDLQLAGVSESDLLPGPIGKSAVTHRAAYLLFQHSTDPVSERKAKRYEARYKQLLDGLAKNAKNADSTPIFYGFGFGPK